MNTPSRLGLILVIGVVVVVLLLIVVQGSDYKPALTGMSSTADTPAVSGTRSTLGVTSTSLPATPIALATDTIARPTSAPTIAPASESTMTAEERKVMEDVKSINAQSEATSPDQCSAILQTQPWCSITDSAKRITRPEWEKLFPRTQFFLVSYTLIGRETRLARHVLVIEQNGQRYKAETFDQLLAVNQLVITEQNRELVAKAFALMTLADYLEQEIDFTDWQAGKWQGHYTYDHYLKAWTKIQGIEFWWWFKFENEQLRVVTRDGVSDYHLGNYSDVPLQTLPLPPLAEYLFAPR
ncbi:hypothetical protein TFLX_06681 [Thermoflexales bacterium]|nr:hypothetical protein TFLX_06681 [Thermoflexales bacterium]